MCGGTGGAPPGSSRVCAWAQDAARGCGRPGSGRERCPALCGAAARGKCRPTATACQRSTERRQSSRSWGTVTSRWGHASPARDHKVVWHVRVVLHKPLIQPSVCPCIHPCPRHPGARRSPRLAQLQGWTANLSTVSGVPREPQGRCRGTADPHLILQLALLAGFHLPFLPFQSLSPKQPEPSEHQYLLLPVPPAQPRFAPF